MIHNGLTTNPHLHDLEECGNPGVAVRGNSYSVYSICLPATPLMVKFQVVSEYARGMTTIKSFVILITGNFKQRV